MGEAFTIEAWIKLDSITDHAVIAAQDDDASGARWRFYFDPTYGLTFDQEGSSGGNKVLVQQGSAAGWNAGVWYHVVVNRLAIGEWTVYRGRGDDKKAQL